MTLGPLMVDLDGTSLSDADRDLLRQPYVGGVVLCSRNFEDPAQLTALTENIHGIRRPPLLVAVDQEGGRVQSFGEPFTALPSARTLGRHYDIDAGEGLALARTCGWTMASELRACGIDLSFAPVVDVDLGLCGVIGDRACHRDPRAVSEISQAYIGGMHEAGMKATAKHFPGHGGVIGDAHPTRPVDQRDYKRLAGGIKPYRALIAAGLESIMMAPVSYPAVDDRPACFSIAWIQGELRGRFGFSGAIFSPVLTARASPDTALGRLAKSAQEAGCDVIVLSGDRDEIEAAGERLEICTPVSQVRRARLHGGRAPAWQRLRMSPGWREARVALESLQSSPELELDGGPGTAG